MRNLVLALTLGALAGFWAGAAEEAKIAPTAQEREALEFKVAGDELMEAGKPAEALAKYKLAFEKDPKHQETLYNGGLAAFLSGDFKTAAEWWKRLKEKAPDDWRLRAKLIQAYQALNDAKARDAERAELFALRAKSKDEDFLHWPSYCRDQLSANGKKVMAFEYFKLEGDRAMRYRFSVLNAEGNKEEYFISLGSYELTNAVARETGSLKEGERLFHLDGYYQGEREHRTFGMFKKEPTYDETRALVIQVLEEKLDALSSSVVGGGPQAKSGEQKDAKVEDLTTCEEKVAYIDKRMGTLKELAKGADDVKDKDKGAAIKKELADVIAEFATLKVKENISNDELSALTARAREAQLKLLAERASGPKQIEEPGKVNDLVKRLNEEDK
ncbi:MAG: hypothetical protein HY291_22140 [Planctomycetes bacterium]|nr:hypothetical protein [Planctomycetota bacterium]